MQQFSYVYTPTAEAFAISKYGNLEPSLNTGEIQYSMPLYTYKDPDFELPISLDYHYQGYRPSMHSGMVGLGWALNTGAGIITREVRGYPDFVREGYIYGFSDTQLVDFGIWNPGIFVSKFSETGIWYFLNDLVDYANLMDVYSDIPVMAADSLAMIGDYAGLPLFDTEPDIFHVSIPDCTFDFILRNGKEPLVFNSSVPYGEPHVSVIRRYNSPQDISEITVKTDKGYTYTFGGSKESCEYSRCYTDYYGPIALPVTTAWKVVSVKAPEGKRSIDFQYDAQSLQRDLRVETIYTPYMHFIGEETWIGEESGAVLDIQTTYINRTEQSNRKRIYVTTCWYPVSSIFISGGPSIRFDYSARQRDECSEANFLGGLSENILTYEAGLGYFSTPKCLSEMTLQRPGGIAARTISFTQTIRTSVPYKMFLSLVEDSARGTHSFSYEDSGSLPYNNDMGKDYWGFWNSRMERNLPEVIDEQYYDTYDLYEQFSRNGYYIYKEPVFACTKQCSLVKITYPTGGFTEIEYESNTAHDGLDRPRDEFVGYGRSFDDEHPVGGIRVRKLKNVSPQDGYADSTVFRYKSKEYPEQSSGVLMNMPRYSVKAEYIYSFFYPDNPITTPFDGIFDVTSISYADPLGVNLVRGSFIAYSDVRKDYSDGSYEEISFSKYEDYPDEYRLSTGKIWKNLFTCRDWVTPTSINNGDEYECLLNPPSIDRSAFRGRIKEINCYSADSALVSSTKYHYEERRLDSLWQYSNALDHFAKTRRIIVTPVLTSTTNTVYENGVPFTVTDSLTCNSYGQVSRMMSYTRDGMGRGTYFKYCHESSLADTCSLPAAVADRYDVVLRDGTEYAVSSEHNAYNPQIPRLTPTSKTRWRTGSMVQFSPSSPEAFRSVSVSRTSQFAYDTLVHITYANVDGVRPYTYAWDPAGKHIVRTAGPDTTVVRTFEWQDLAGPTRIVDKTGIGSVYTYDSASRLKSETGSFGYREYTYKTDTTAAIHPIGIGYCDVEFPDLYAIWDPSDTTVSCHGGFVDMYIWPDYYTIAQLYDIDEYDVDGSIICDYWDNYVMEEMFPFEYGVTAAADIMTIYFPPNNLAIRKSFTFYSDSGESVTIHQDAVGYERAALGGAAGIAVNTFTDAGHEYSYRDITWYNGLGYPSQYVQYRGGGDGGSVITPVTYDGSRRYNARTWLPFSVQMPDSHITANPIQEQEDYYDNALWSNDSRYFTETTFEGYQDGRPLTVQRPGSVFENLGKRTRIEYSVNSVADSVLCLKYIYPVQAAGEPSFTVLGMTPDSTLRKTTSVNEDGDTSVSFKDALGRLVCSRQYADSLTRCDTYFIYDLRDSLVCVVQPEGSVRLAVGDTLSFTSDFARKWCFRNKYDAYGNLTHAAIPGTAYSVWTYDGRDRPVTFASPEMQARGIVQTTAYNDMDDIVEQRYQQDNTSIPSVQRYYCPYNSIPSYLSFVPEPGIVTQSDLNMTSVKTLLAYEVQYEVPEMNYNYGLSQPVFSRERAYYYDNRGRLIQTVEKDSDGWSARYSTKYDFAGRVVATKEGHKDTTGIENAITSKYERDLRGRVLKYMRELDGSPLDTLRYHYDVLGRLSYITVGDRYEDDYTYDLQGRLRDRLSYYEGQEVFGEFIGFESAYFHYPSYSGKISGIETMRTDCVYKDTHFRYDGIGRLVDSEFEIDAEPYWENIEQDIRYDRNGNVVSLDRYNGETLSRLYFSHDANRMITVRDTTENVANAYQYYHDSNGNLLGNTKEGLDISNNVFNLPFRISEDVNDVYQTYLPDGTKTAVSAWTGAGTKWRGSFVYTKGTSSPGYKLSAISWDEGMIHVADSTFTDALFVKDHLGSTRTVLNLSDKDAYSAESVTLETRDYLPYGTEASGTANAEYVTWPYNRWRYEGKEGISNPPVPTGLKDFGARYYDPYAVRWNSPDPMTQSYPQMSPLLYCAGSPINVVDPYGSNIWTMDEYGYLLPTVITEEFDAIVIIHRNADLSFEEVARIHLPYGSIHQVYLPNKLGYVFEIKRNVDNQIDIYSTLVENTMVEWSFVDYFWPFRTQIGTSNEIRINYTLPYSIKNHYLFVNNAIHSHPSNFRFSNADYTIMRRYPRPNYFLYYKPSSSLLSREEVMNLTEEYR